MAKCSEDGCQSNDEEINEMKDDIMNWMRNDAPFKGRIETSFVRKFLEGCNFKVEMTKKKLTRYYEMKRKNPNWLTNRSISEPRLADLLNRGVVCSLKQRNSNGCRVIMITMSKIEPMNNIVDSVMKLLFLVMDSYLIMDNAESISGTVWIVNCDNFPKSILFQVTPVFLYNAVSCMATTFPIKTKGIYIVNINRLCLTATNLIRMLITKKLRERLVVTGQSQKTLYEQLKIDCLPVEHGGSGGTFQQNIDWFRDELMQSRDELLDDEKYGFSS